MIVVGTRLLPHVLPESLQLLVVFGVDMSEADGATCYGAAPYPVWVVKNSSDALHRYGIFEWLLKALQRKDIPASELQRYCFAFGRGTSQVAVPAAATTLSSAAVSPLSRPFVDSVVVRTKIATAASLTDLEVMVAFYSAEILADPSLTVAADEREIALKLTAEIALAADLTTLKSLVEQKQQLIVRYKLSASLMQRLTQLKGTPKDILPLPTPTAKLAVETPAQTYKD